MAEAQKTHNIRHQQQIKAIKTAAGYFSDELKVNETSMGKATSM